MPLTPNYLRDILQWDFAVDESTLRAISRLDLHAAFQLYKTLKRVRKYSNRLTGNHTLQAGATVYAAHNPDLPIQP